MLNHRLTLNACLTPVVVLVISTDAQCHDAGPNRLPVSSCPMRMRSIFPTSLAWTLKTSLAPRSKLFTELSRESSPLSPLSPKMTSETFASQPLPRMSEVTTCTT